MSSPSPQPVWIVNVAVAGDDGGVWLPGFDGSCWGAPGPAAIWTPPLEGLGLAWPGYGAGVGSEQSPVERAIDRALMEANETLARSNDALRALAEMISSQRSALEAADSTLERVSGLLGDVDVDLVALDAEARPEIPRVLVVDDNVAILSSLRTLLIVSAPGDLEVRTVESGEQALELVPWRPDLVILDWQMPGLGGLETARRLRHDLPESRVVMYSALEAAEAEPVALAAGADRYVEKGRDVEALLEEVAAVARRVSRSS